MKLVRHRANGDDRVAILIDGQLVDLADVGRPERSLLDALMVGPAERHEMIARAVALIDRGSSTAVDTAELLAPIARPPKFLAMAYNGKHDPAEMLSREDLPEAFRLRLERVVATERLYRDDVPEIFNKQTSCVSGPRADIYAPPDSRELDYEGELAIVIGARARRLTVSDAVNAVAGYTVTNDVSIRDWQFDTPTHWMGKSFETFGPTGPAVVTPDEIDPDHVRIRTWVNGEIRQDGNTDERRMTAAEIVAWISQRCTLEPGDLIATGTGGGLAQFTGRYMEPGDLVAVEIDGIGRLENRIVMEPLSGFEALGIGL